LGKDPRIVENSHVFTNKTSTRVLQPFNA
jgi:hypothetical protein